MKRKVCIILILSLGFSMLSLSAAAESAENSQYKKPIVSVAYYEDETCEPEWGTECPLEEPSCAPEWETEAPSEEPSCAPEPDPTESPATEVPSEAENSCGSSAYYSFDEETGILQIYGSGYVDSSPWLSFRDKIVSLIVDGVNNVPNHAFENCPNLESIVIGDTVTSLGYGEYDYDREWWNRYYPPNTFSGCEKLKTVTLGNGIAYLSGGEFEGCTALENVDLPDGLESIGQSSFSGCVQLSDIVFPDTLTSIGNNAFSECTSVKPQSFAHITYIGNYAFANCAAIESVEFGSKVERIGQYAFANCTALRCVVFADGTDYLGDGVFSGCTLSEFRFNGELGSATGGAFAGATFDDDFWQDDVLYIGDILIKANNSISGTCRIRDGVKKIFSYAFAGCDKLDAVILPDSVTSICEYAFSNCYSLNSLKIGSGLTEIGYSAFQNCSVLNTVDIPDIGKWLDVSFVYSIHRGGGSGGWTETSYTANPFFYGAKLYINGELTENLVIDNRQTIKSYSFYGCKGIKSLKIMGDVSAVGRNAFFGCTGLQEVTLGKNVEKVEANAFWNCAKLKKITFLNPDCQIANAYETISGAAVIYGYDDSTAQMYAGNYNRNFVLLDNQPAICGDADGDGEVTSIDVAIIQRYCADMYTGIDEQTLMNADVDKNGFLEITDATFLQRYLALMNIPYAIGVEM